PTPPSPPLFPYTTLFRSVERRDVVGRDEGHRRVPARRGRVEDVVRAPAAERAPTLQRPEPVLPRPSVVVVPEVRRLERRNLGGRSEEHTSELQSRSDLVC